MSSRHIVVDGMVYHALTMVANSLHEMPVASMIVCLGMLPNASVRSKWRMVWSGREWKVLERSLCKVFAPSGVPMPNWVGCNVRRSAGVVWRRNVLAVIRRRTVGTPMGAYGFVRFEFCCEAGGEDGV